MAHSPELKPALDTLGAETTREEIVALARLHRPASNADLIHFLETVNMAMNAHDFRHITLDELAPG